MIIDIIRGEFMQSYGLRIVNKFDINGALEITRTKNSIPVVGKITKNNTPVTLAGIAFTVYDCEFYKDKKNEIIIDGSSYSEFKEVNPFKLYYSSQKKLLIANASLTICTPFFKYLMDSNPDLVSYSGIVFDFVKIVRNKALVDQVWFGTSDVHARTKSFNGVRVDKNKEAMRAIEGGKATFIKVQIDVASNGKNKKRTVGFSKKSGITIFKSNDVEINNLEKKFQLLMDTYNTYGSFK